MAVFERSVVWTITRQQFFPTYVMAFGSVESLELTVKQFEYKRRVGFSFRQHQPLSQT